MATFREYKKKNGKTTVKARILLVGMARPIYFSAPNITTARKVADRMEAEIKSGKLVPEELRRTVADLIDAYLEEVLPTAGDSAKWVERKKAVLPMWREALGSLKLSEIEGHHVATVRRTRLREGVSTSTVNREVAILSAVFKAGRKELGWVKRGNPCADVERFDERGKERRRHLTDGEYDTLMAACDKACEATDISAEWLRTIIDLGMATGQRRTRIEELRWPHVDLSWSTEGKPEDCGWVTFVDTKNDDNLTLPVFEPALSRLRALHRGVRRLDTDLLFSREDGKKPVYTRRAWESAVDLARLNVGIADSRDKAVFHSIRHTVGSRILEAGGTTRDVMEHLGQRTETMARRYAHASGLRRRDIARRLADRASAGSASS